MLNRKLYKTMLGVIACSTLSFAQAPTPVNWVKGPGRLAISHDGNNYDEDDTYAMPMCFALMTAYGLQSKLVHVEHSVIISNQPTFYGNMVKSADAINQFPGFDKSILFDQQIPAQVIAGRANFKAQAEKSSANDLLYFTLGGPMDYPYQDIQAVKPEFRKYIVCISHSLANDKMGTAAGRKGWDNICADFKADGLQCVHIKDQNANLGGSGSSRWDFLKTMPPSSLMPPAACAWLRTRDWKANGDCSDNGMAFYAITGRDNGTYVDYKAAFLAPKSPGTTGISFSNSNRFSGNSISVNFAQNSNVLNIITNGMTGNKSIEMYNPLSQKVLASSLSEGETQIHTGTLPKGKYFLKVSSKEQSAFKEVLVK